MISDLLLVFLVTLLPRLLLAARLHMTGDEGFYIFTGTVCLRNIIRRDFSESSWAVEYHPPFLMTLYAAAYSVYVLLRVVLRGSLSLEEIYAEGAASFSGRGTLFAIRLLPVLLVSLASIPLYLLTEDFTGSSRIALAAVLFFALMPVSIGITSLTILEPGLIFFYIISLWLFVSAVGSPSSLTLVFLSGVFLGFAMASREGGYFLPVSIVTISALGTVFPSKFSFLAANYDGLLALWTVVGVLTLYVLWPFLWRHPMSRIRENFAIVARMKGEKNAGWTYNLREIAAGTPFFVSALGVIGLLVSVVQATKDFGFSVVLLLFAVPLILLSKPSFPQRGIHSIYFVVPFLSILPAVATVAIAEAMSPYLALSTDVSFYGLLGVFAGSLVILDFRLFPDYFQFRDLVGGRFYKWGDGVGQWGEGIDEAMKYIDGKAPPNSEVWIYGLKFPSLYHSDRVNVSESLKGAPLFFTRFLETGYGEFDDSEYRNWKSGDLAFFFPYYQTDLTEADLVRMLSERNVGYIVVHRWARNDPALTANTVDPGNYSFISELFAQSKPEYVVRVRNQDLCWIFSAKDFLEIESARNRKV